MTATPSLLKDCPPGGLDLVSLDAHLLACERALGAAFPWYCLGERAHSVIGPRLVTTVLSATGLMALLAAFA
jgi:hypothetical protein